MPKPKVSATPRPTGRPSKFDKKFVAQVYEMALLGLIDEELAKVFDVSKKTLYTWGREHPEFMAARRRGGVVADARVARGLHERACGYSHAETLVHVHLGRAIKTRVIKHYPPDTQAATQWLHNRQAARWRREPDPNDGPAEATPVKVVIEVKSARTRPDDANAQRTAS